VADKVKIRADPDYRDLAQREAGAFDRIVSVRMFEHVGTAAVSRPLLPLLRQS